jgi:hypothetical protein
MAGISREWKPKSISSWKPEQTLRLGEEVGYLVGSTAPSFCDLRVATYMQAPFAFIIVLIIAIIVIRIDVSTKFVFCVIMSKSHYAN